MKRIYTKGNVEVQNIKIGDVHYEFEWGYMISSVVETLPKQSDNDPEYWEWTSKTLDGRIINYRVSEKHSHYAPNIYDFMAYQGCKEL